MEEFKPGDKVMFKHDNNQVFIFIKKIGEEKALCIDTQNKEHEVYLVSIEAYKRPSFL